MIFSSMLFLWAFLPITLLFYYIADKRYKNIILLIVSLFFYAWGEPIYIVLMLVTITVNYAMGLIINRTPKRKKIWLTLTIIINLGLLGYFKYYNMLVDTIKSVANLQSLSVKEIALPIGISFYTFQALSYVVDLYRGEIKVQKNWYKLALYISFFPQLIAGPIVKYKDVCEQIDNRKCTVDKFAYGVKRFIYGLGKKVIISNSMALIVDSIFELDMNYVGTSLAWCIAICYTLQIYFDFSGYSDMAIGLGKMFGFDFMENFNYPYISKSIQEFWRRWHISLSTWFREYLYIPLGGNRKGKVRTYINLFIVFFCTGLWHGASYTFVLWGLFHGIFMIIERLFLGKILDKNPIKVINHIYTLFVVMIGWVLFRAEKLDVAVSLIKNMFVYKSNGLYSMFYYVDVKSIVIIAIAIIIGFILPLTSKKRHFIEDTEKTSVIEIILCVLIMGYSMIMLISNTYNPFIYFRF